MELHASHEETKYAGIQLLDKTVTPLQARQWERTMEKESQVEIILLHDWTMSFISWSWLTVSSAHVHQFCPILSYFSRFFGTLVSGVWCLVSVVSAIALLGLDKIASKPQTSRLRSWLCHLLAMWPQTRTF